MERMSADAVIQVHGLPQLLAGLDVEKRHDKENRGEEEHDDVLHARSLDSEPRT